MAKYENISMYPSAPMTHEKTSLLLFSQKHLAYGAQTPLTTGINLLSSFLFTSRSFLSICQRNLKLSCKTDLLETASYHNYRYFLLKIHLIKCEYICIKS